MTTPRGVVAMLISAALASVAAGAAVAASRPVYFEGADGRAVIWPSHLQLSGDGTLEAYHMHWSTWGGSMAVGSGTAAYHGCKPTCGNAPVHHARVQVYLSHVKTCSGRRYYSRAWVTRRRTGKPIHARWLTRMRYAPC